MPFHVLITNTFYRTVTYGARFISLYALFYFGFQAVEYQGVLFFLPVKHQFKDGGFKSIVSVYSVEFSVLGDYRLYLVIIVCILSAIGVLLLFVLFIVKKHRQFFFHLFYAWQCRF